MIDLVYEEDNEAPSVRVSDGKANSHVDCMMISHAGVVASVISGLLGAAFETKFPMKLPSCFAFRNDVENLFGEGRLQ